MAVAELVEARLEILPLAKEGGSPMETYEVLGLPS
jgi:hypothetical protein